MSILTDIGDSLISSVTGQSPAQLTAQLDAAEQQLQVAVSTIIALEAIIAVEALLVVVMLWKTRRGA